MQCATLSNCDSDAFMRSNSHSIFQQHSLVQTIKITAVIQYILTAAQLLDSRDYYNKSSMVVLQLVRV